MLQSSQDQATAAVARTLKMYDESGRLPRLPFAELREEFAGITGDNPEGVRRITSAMIRRIDAYWTAIDYCPPMTHRSTGETPTARPAPQFEAQYGTFDWVRINDSAAGPDKVWSEAKSMCLNTALLLAQWEFGQILPESGELLRQGRIAAMSACKSEDIAGSRWVKNSNKLTTSGVRKRLRQTLNAMPYAYLVLHPDSGQPAFLVAEEFQRRAPAMEARAREANRPLPVSAPRDAATRTAA